MLGVFAAGHGQTSLGYVLTGNIVLSLLLSTMGSVSSNFAFMRAVGRLTLATLPIYRSALILATVLAFLVMSLPSVAMTLLLGTLILNVPLALSPWIVIVAPLISISLSGLGALIGLIGRAPEEVGSIQLLVTAVLLGLGPVLIPADQLPEAIRQIGLLSPATYAASALRQVVLGWSDRIPLAVDLVILTTLSVGLLWLVGQRMDWRQAA